VIESLFVDEWEAQEMATKVVRALVLLVTLVPGIGRAEALGRFVYQGRLLKENPSGPATGPVKMVFAIYDQAEGGSPLWVETQPSVALTDGFYATYLGDQVALTADLFAGGERYLELTVNDETLRPRVRLASVPSALACASLSGGPVAATSLSAQGGLATALGGTVSTSAGNAAVVGSGTHFKAELKVGDAVRVGTGVYTVKSITSDTGLELAPAAAANLAGASLFRDGTLFRVANGAQTTHLAVTQSGDLGLRTEAPRSSLSFGATHSSSASGCLDRPHGYVWNGACRNDVVSVYEDGEDKYGLGIHGATLEIFSPQGAKSQIGVRNNGVEDGSLTGQFTPMLEVGDGYLRIGNVSAPSSNTTPGAGPALLFSGGPSMAGSAAYDSENSDRLAIYRYNASSDVTEMRVQIGDNETTVALDKFVVGATSSANNLWAPAFTVHSNGDYKFAGATVSTRESKRDIRAFDERALDLLRPVQVVSYHYKEDAGDRAPRVGIIANDPGHKYDPRLTNNGTGFDTQTAAALLIKAVQEQQALIEEQRAEIARLHAIVCRDRPDERLCRP
jgi:hypothetical protein